MRRAEMLLLKSLAETLMADRDNRHDDLQATMRLAHLSSPEMILYMVNLVSSSKRASSGSPRFSRNSLRTSRCP